MSHFTTLVMVEPRSGKQLTQKQLEAEVGRRLAPYDENTSVPNYKQACYCVGAEARAAARSRVELVDPLDGYRERFKVEHPLPEGVADEFHLGSRGRRQRQKAWEKFIEPYTRAEQEAEQAHPMYQKPNPSCDECGGSGRADTTYNPDSKWDWWAIGGRWTGALGGYDPRADPDNLVSCWICDGTGKRVAPPQTGPGDQKCNGCDGTGRTLKFPTEWKNEGNVAPARVVLDLAESSKFVPFALVTPDGKWHESARMGWWAMTSDDKEPDDWQREVVEHLKASPTAVCVLVDCHI